MLAKHHLLRHLLLCLLEEVHWYLVAVNWSLLVLLLRYDFFDHLDEVHSIGFLDNLERFDQTLGGKLLV